MNQAKKSAVRSYPDDSLEFALVQSLCAQTIEETNVTNLKSGRWSEFRNVLMKVVILLLENLDTHSMDLLLYT